MKTVIELARQFSLLNACLSCEIKDEYAAVLEAFAELVAEQEREACHALRQTLPNPHKNCQVSAHAYDMALVAYGSAIRARGKHNHKHRNKLDIVN